jgi:hypothetical protein
MTYRSITELEVLRGDGRHLQLPGGHRSAGGPRQPAPRRGHQVDRGAPTDRLYRGAPVRGVAADVELDEAGFAGEGEMYLFASILNEMLASYVSLNSFTQLTVTGHEHARGVQMGAEERQPLPDLTEADIVAVVERGSAALRLLPAALRSRAVPPGSKAHRPARRPPSLRRRSAFARIRHRLPLERRDGGGGSIKTARTASSAHRVTTTFMGLYGSTSPLPPLLHRGDRADEHQGQSAAGPRVLDVIHHRMCRLLYRTWTKYRFCRVQVAGARPLHAANVVRGGHRRVRRAQPADPQVPLSALRAPCSRGARAPRTRLDMALQELFGEHGREHRAVRRRTGR